MAGPSSPQPSRFHSATQPLQIRPSGLAGCPPPTHSSQQPPWKQMSNQAHHCQERDGEGPSCVQKDGNGRQAGGGASENVNDSKFGLWGHREAGRESPAVAAAPLSSTPGSLQGARQAGGGSYIGLVVFVACPRMAVSLPQPCLPGALQERLPLGFCSPLPRTAAAPPSSATWEFCFTHELSGTAQC